MTSSMESESLIPWMDKSWMQKILRDVEDDPTLTITDCQVNNSDGKGDHYLSEMHRITVKLERAGSKESKIFMIAKKLPSGKEMHKILSKSTSFPTEIKMFSQILPKLANILEGAAPRKFNPFAARHICSKNNMPYFLIVSDLAPEGFRMANRLQGLDLDHCLLVMKTLGRFHAASVALYEKDPQIIESFKENIFTEESSSDFMKYHSKSAIVSIAKFVPSWPEGSDTIAKKLLKVADTVCQQLRQQFSPEGNRLNVLAHGDVWTNNILFKYNDATSRVEDLRFVDFQVCCYASCAMDLQYFMYTSPRHEVRVAHEEDLLREYHNELCSTLKLLGLTNKAITFQELLDEYERKGVFGFLVSLYLLPNIMADTDDVTELEEVMDRCNKTDFLDKRVTNNKAFLNLMQKLLPVFERKGYL